MLRNGNRPGQGAAYSVGDDNHAPDTRQHTSTQLLPSKRAFSSGQSGQHSYADRALDSYPTPPTAVHSLLAADSKLDPSKVCIWEPCAGTGNVALALRDHGFPVIASDIVARGFNLHFIGDFLEQTKAPAGCNVVLTNPPFKEAQQFAEHAIGLVPDVYLLLRLAFLESIRRTRLLEHSGLRAVHVFRRRLPRMHREGWNGRRTSSSIAFAWFCWSRDYRGPAIVTRI